MPNSAWRIALLYQISSNPLGKLVPFRHSAFSSFVISDGDVSSNQATCDIFAPYSGKIGFCMDSVTPFLCTREPLNIAGSLHLTYPRHPIAVRKTPLRSRAETSTEIRGIKEAAKRLCRLAHQSHRLFLRRIVKGSRINGHNADSPRFCIRRHTTRECATNMPVSWVMILDMVSLVYADKPQTLDHLEDNIRRVIADIRPQILEKVIENWTSRLDYIGASRGSPMPEIIFKINTLYYGNLLVKVTEPSTAEHPLYREGPCSLRLKRPPVRVEVRKGGATSGVTLASAGLSIGCLGLAPRDPEGLNQIFWL
ncbi:hypothetical protein TNCV_1808781 [Trichonephila clavipes]|nr:hypothetical protein TNCV_1808781 [Trichonephila clavipes]